MLANACHAAWSAGRKDGEAMRRNGREQSLGKGCGGGMWACRQREVDGDVVGQARIAGPRSHSPITKPLSSHASQRFRPRTGSCGSIPYSTPKGKVLYRCRTVDENVVLAPEIASIAMTWLGTLGIGFTAHELGPPSYQAGVWLVSDPGSVLSRHSISSPGFWNTKVGTTMRTR
nr:hypothetical protein CFP56_02484 [Quercus suber]